MDISNISVLLKHKIVFNWRTTSYSVVCIWLTHQHQIRRMNVFILHIGGAFGLKGTPVGESSRATEKRAMAALKSE